MSDKKINYASKDYAFFHSRFSCTNELVDEEFFIECMDVPQTPRPHCDAIGAKALCEQCEYFGRESWTVDPKTGNKIMQENALGKELAR